MTLFRRLSPGARLVVENSVEIGRLEQEGGRDQDFVALMLASTHALSAAI